MEGHRTPGLIVESLAAIVLLLVAVDTTNANEPAQPQGEYVVELGFLGRLPAGAAHYATALGITADGCICLPREGEETLAVADRMLPEQLAGLLQEIERTGQLRELQSDQLRQQIAQACEAAGFAFEIDGAAETVIRCRNMDGMHEVRCPALSVMAARFPDFPAVQRLLTIQLRLQNIAAVAQAGGEQVSTRLAETANRTLQLSHPELPPLTPRDLSMVRQLATGSRYIQFYRPPSAGGEELLVSLFETPGTDPRVSVLLNPTTPQQ